MEHSSKYPKDGDIEDGELSEDSDDGYTPLQRPSMQPITASSATAATKMEGGESNSDFGRSSESSSDSDDEIKEATRPSTKEKKKNKQRTVLLRVKPMEELQERQSRFKKYNIWTASLQEDSLMENMRGFDVAQDQKNNRSVETYDYLMKYRLNGENKLKRRLSNSEDDYSDEAFSHQSKRTKCGSSKGRKHPRERLGRFSRGSSSDSQNAPRNILDLTVTLENEAEDIAKDIANKLAEEKDDLLVRIVEVLGKELPIEIFKETQRIEKDGGMMVMNGFRRRTPGGVFFFLLKHHDRVSQEDKNRIFREETKKSSKDKKIQQAIKRDQKVQELKKCLSQTDKKLVPLTSRSELYAISLLKPETNGTLSNPPPSPNCGQENSPEYKPHEINHVNDISPEKATTATARIGNDFDDESLTPYDDDFLDMHCDEMDMF